jgi:hypothetical protein
MNLHGEWATMQAVYQLLAAQSLKRLHRTKALNSIAAYPDLTA